MLYQGSKSEGSWCLINTVNDSTLAFNFTRNSLQVHEDSLTASHLLMVVCVYID